MYFMRYAEIENEMEKYKAASMGAEGESPEQEEEALRVMGDSARRIIELTDYNIPLIEGMFPGCSLLHFIEEANSPTSGLFLERANGVINQAQLEVDAARAYMASIESGKLEW